MIPIGKTEPSIVFPVGAVIEDPMMIAEILHKYPKTRTGHMYKVKVLTWKMELPEGVKQHLDKPDEIHISVFEENMANIKRIQ
jgi:hypothetical protein